MSLDAETVLCLRHCDQRGEKDDWRAAQFGIGLDLCRYFGAVFLWHHDVQQNHVRSKIPGTLMSLAGVVLLEHQIVAGFFEKDFDQMRAFPIVINDQDAPFFFHQRPGDGIDLRLIEPINMRLRWILSGDVRGVDAKSVGAFDHLAYAGYLRVYSISHRSERDGLSVDFLRGNGQVHCRRLVAHSACVNLVLSRCKESSEHI